MRVAAGDLEREVVVLEHGGGDVQREVAALGQARAWLSSASRMTASSSSTPMSTACASRKQRSVGRACAVGVGEAGERLGADDPAAGQVDDRLEGDVEPVAVDQPLHARLDALAAHAVERDALLVGTGALALGDEVLR